MNRDVGDENTSILDENSQQRSLLAWATMRIDQLADPGGPYRLDDLVDWLAYFTREFFGFQHRMLSECGEQQEYLSARMAAHCEFRRRLAELSIDTLRGDTTVPVRLRKLCHDLLADAEANDRKLAEIVGTTAPAPKLRRKPRQAQPADRATELFEQPAAAEADAVTTAHH